MIRTPSVSPVLRRGPGVVAACGCVPANGETPGNVARILGLMACAGAAADGALAVWLVR